MEERERILAEARKRVPGADRRPTAQPHFVDEGFPLLWPNWDFERVEGRERLQVYRQTLMAALWAAARKPTNLAKINLVRQEPTESPAAFLERLMEAFRQYTPMDPQAEESRTAVLIVFVNQAAPDIRKKLQKIERVGEQTIQDLLKAAEKVFNNREKKGKPIGFMVDIGAQHSVFNQNLGPMSKRTSLVQGAMGTKRYYWIWGPTRCPIHFW